MRHKFISPLVTLSATLLFLTAPAFAQIQLPDLETEIAMGRQVSSELEQKVTFVQDPVVAEYINRIGQNLVTNSDAKIPFTIRVIDSAEISAIALPGGFLFVNKGLILASDDEPELVAVIAHEIAHVIARHAVQQYQKASLLKMAAVPAMTFGSGIPASVIQQAAAIGVPLTFIAFTRSAEEEADLLGLQYMFKAGYDPNAMVSWFEKLRIRQGAGSTVSALFATHPQTEDRTKLAQKNIVAYLPARTQTAIPPAEFQGIKARLAAGRN